MKAAYSRSSSGLRFDDSFIKLIIFASRNLLSFARDEFGNRESATGFCRR